MLAKNYGFCYGLFRWTKYQSAPAPPFAPLPPLLIFGALNWSVQWYDTRKGVSLDELADAAMALFIGDNPVKSARRARA